MPEVDVNNCTLTCLTNEIHGRGGGGVTQPKPKNTFSRLGQTHDRGGGEVVSTFCPILSLILRFFHSSILPTNTFSINKYIGGPRGPGLKFGVVQPTRPWSWPTFFTTNTHFCTFNTSHDPFLHPFHLFQIHFHISLFYLRYVEVGGSKPDPPSIAFFQRKWGVGIPKWGSLNPITPPANRTLVGLAILSFRL